MKLNKPQPRTVTFDRLLRRRGLSFEAWAASTGVSSYAEVVRWCDRIGAIPPSEAEWLSYMPAPVNAPTDGIVVVDVEDRKSTRLNSSH